MWYRYKEESNFEPQMGGKYRGKMVLQSVRSSCCVRLLLLVGCGLLVLGMYCPANYTRYYG